jgi:hypothetical protein
VGTYSGDDAHANRQYIVVLVIILVAIGIVFGVVLPRSEGGANAARTALILSVLGLLSVAVFWAGLPRYSRSAESSSHARPARAASLAPGSSSACSRCSPTSRSTSETNWDSYTAARDRASAMMRSASARFPKP